MPNQVNDFIFFVDDLTIIIELSVDFLCHFEVLHDSFYTFVRNGYHAKKNSASYVVCVFYARFVFTMCDV